MRAEGLVEPVEDELLLYSWWGGFWSLNLRLELKQEDCIVVLPHTIIFLDSDFMIMRTRTIVELEIYLGRRWKRKRRLGGDENFAEVV